MKKRFLACLFVLTVLFGAVYPIWIFANGTEVSADKPLAGKRISIMGDSISTYVGWSDSKPITGEECTYRYGEPYYGPEGCEEFCHNRELRVDDTWWYQAAEELGAEILVNNSGNSTGLLHASYPSNLEWQQYLQEMLAYKTRPYYLGTSEYDPDIIALYIGSSDVRFDKDKFGTVEDIDFSSLIVENSDGTYSYAEPLTVAEAYCILLHKVSVTYPDAEIYCFTVVPSAGGYLSTCNTRLASTLPYNDMIKTVAERYGAIVVDIFEEFALDPDYDGVATQEDFDEFQSCYNGDPHPNAKGFDVITECFVDTVRRNSKYIVSVETTAGKTEDVGVNVLNSGGIIRKSAQDYVTESGMTVDFNSEHNTSADFGLVYSEEYTSVDSDNTYQAQGGAEKTLGSKVPGVSIVIPLVCVDNDQTEENETVNTVLGNPVGLAEITGDQPLGKDDGIYDYTKYYVTKQGQITAKTLSVELNEKIVSENHNSMSYVRSNAVPTEENNLITDAAPVVIPQTEDEVPEITPGYEYVYLGSDLLSNFYAAFAYNEPSSGYLNETPVYTDEFRSLYVGAKHSQFGGRGLVVPKLYLKEKTVEGSFPARYDSIQQYTLSDNKCGIITAYCADQVTSTRKGYGYRLVNLEDASYYSVSEAEMIRTVASNGYWGTKSGFGSLDALKQELTDSGLFTEEEVEAVNDGIAMTATQYAIWTFSNLMNGHTYVNVHYTDSVDNSSFSRPDDETVALIFKLYNYLIDLAPTPVSNDKATTRNTVINEHNFLNNLTFGIKGKVSDHPDNADEDETNDVYVADISFSLVARPDARKDNLILRIEDEDGNCISVGRIAGELQDGEVLLVPGDTGEYTFNDVQISEGVENLSFILYGKQYLEKTPYLLISEERDGESSQTLVCVAEGDRNVNVVMDLSFELDISDESFSMERAWRTERNIPVLPPETTTQTTTETTTETTVTTPPETTAQTTTETGATPPPETTTQTATETTTETTVTTPPETTAQTTAETGATPPPETTTQTATESTTETTVTTPPETTAQTTAETGATPPPETTTVTEFSAGQDLPQTGNTGDVILWIAVFHLASFVIVVIVFLGGKFFSILK